MTEYERIEELDQDTIIAIDPGDKHVGWARFRIADGVCVDARELTPDECLDSIYTWLLGSKYLKALVVEEFRLYPWQAEQQAFSQMLTCELIGQLRLLWRWVGGGADGAVAWVEQGAIIKKPTRALMTAHKVPSLAKVDKTGGHAADAELHGRYYLHKTLELPFPSREAAILRD